MFLNVLCPRVSLSEPGANSETGCQSVYQPTGTYKQH